jgi:hypothetical protein
VVIAAAVATLVAGDVVATRVYKGVPTSSMPVAPVYSPIANDSRDVVVLAVPSGVRTGTDQIGPGEDLTFYQPIHRKRIANGMLARSARSAGVLSPLTGAPVLRHR